MSNLEAHHQGSETFSLSSLTGHMAASDWSKMKSTQVMLKYGLGDTWHANLVLLGALVGHLRVTSC